MNTLRLLPLLPLTLCACTSSSSITRSHHASAASPDTTQTAWSAPNLEHCISIRDGKTGERLTFATLLDQLSQSQAVFLGETHIDETTHRVELAVYDGLLSRRSGKVVLAMEMFERDTQPALDAYLTNQIDEPTFLSRSRPWSNYKTAYRPLIELAREKHRPVIASNFPAPLRSKITNDKGASLDNLSADERAFAPRELLANTPAYWRRVDNAIRGHVGMMGPRPDANDPRLFDTQSLWDNTMGESCALALDRHPDHTVLHVNGGFHTEYHDGTARQLLLRRPNTRASTVAIVTSDNPQTAELGGLPFADYVVFAAERAQDIDEGKYSVFVTRQLDYRLHLPPAATTPGAKPVPLLIWLADDGESAQDALELWKQRVGDECALAIVEAPYRETQDDLVEGGRWFWPDSFREDIALLRDGIDGAWSYILRHHPVDPTRVVLAGEGTGATVVSATTLLSDGLAVHALALAPRRYSSIKDFPLPLPELRGDLPKVEKSLHVLAAPADEEWWKGELGEYTAIGLSNELAPLPSDVWRDELERENVVRTALGLTPRPLAADAKHVHLVVGESTRARAWGRLLALERARAGEALALLDAEPKDASSQALELGVRAQDYAAGAPLPRAPGPFGGTTVLVLPATISAAEREAWTELAKNDPLNKQSRFHRVVIATQGGERALPVVLEELIGKNRKNVLIVPAMWCADGETMRALRTKARAFENRMTIHWRPGLGGMRAR